MWIIILFFIVLLMMVTMVWIGVHEQRKAKQCPWISYLMYALTILIAIPWLFYGAIFVAIILYGV